MVNQDNLDKLCEAVLNDTALTTKALNEMGFKAKDLSDLINDNVLVRVKRGLYSLKSGELLFYYGKSLIGRKEYDKANLCFQKCFSIEPTNSGAAFQLFMRCIKDKDYEKAFQYFDVFYGENNELDDADYKFYLFLLSMITELPPKHKDFAKFLKYEDFKVMVENYRYDTYKQNKMRLSAFNQRFLFAIKQLNECVREKGKKSLQDVMIKLLLVQAAEVQAKNRETAINLIKEEKYEEVVEFYEGIATSHRLSMSDNYIVTLTKQLLDIRETKRIPKKEIFTTDKLFKAIDGKNFELALSLAGEGHKPVPKEESLNGDGSTEEKAYLQSNAIYLILKLIVDECNKLQASSGKRQEKNSYAKLESRNKQDMDSVLDLGPAQKEKEKMADTRKQANSKVGSQSTSTKWGVPKGKGFTEIISFLMRGDLDNSFSALRSYLVDIGKSDYEFLIINLVKASLLERDMAFTKPMIALSLISRDNYSFDLSTYIQEFYINLAQNKFDMARVYLDIISKGNKLGQSCIMTNGLYKVLETSEKMAGYKENAATMRDVDVAWENSKVKVGSGSSFSEERATGYADNGTNAGNGFDAWNADNGYDSDNGYYDGDSGFDAEYTDNGYNDEYNGNGYKNNEYTDGYYGNDFVRNEDSIDEPVIVQEAYDASNKKVRQKEEVSREDLAQEQSFLDEKYDELLDKEGIILLKPMSKERIDKILNMADDYPDMVAFVIEQGSKEQVVLRYKPVDSEYIDVKGIIAESAQSFNDKDYDKCIECNLQLLRTFKHPRSIVYSRLGLSYMKKGEIGLAVQYLTVANDLAKKENLEYDYSDLIARLNGDIAHEDMKPVFKMSQQDFDYSDVNDFYGIKDFEEINSLIIETGLDVESACHQLGMSDEDTAIIELIYAKEYYANGDFDRGDLFLRSVERCKNKTDEVKRIFKEIRKNKRFYQNRKESNKELVLAPATKRKLKEKSST